MLPATLQFLIVMIASAINDRLQRKLDYVEEERRILWEQVEALTGGRKISFTPTLRGEGIHGALPCRAIPPGPGRSADREASRLGGREWGKG